MSAPLVRSDDTYSILVWFAMRRYPGREFDHPELEAIRQAFLAAEQEPPAIPPGDTGRK